MKNKILLLAVFLGVSLFLSSGVLAEKCYQESANVSTACGGVTGGYYSIGSYPAYINASNIFDGNWDTYGTDNVSNDGSANSMMAQIVYKKPVGFTNESRLLIKTSQTLSNVSIPQSCLDFDANSNIIQFLIIGHTVFNSSYTYMKIYCANGTGSDGAMSVTPMYTYYKQNSTSAEKFYEEAMWWDIKPVEVLHDSCYQESANVSTACGGVNGGYYSISSSNNFINLSNLFDGKWDTFAIDNESNVAPFSGRMAQIVYKRPQGATSASKMTIKTKQGKMNVSIPQSCWNFDGNLNTIQFFLDSNIVVTNGVKNSYVTLSCASGPGSLQIMYNYSLKNSTEGARFYEEGMNWDIKPLPLSLIMFQFNGKYAYVSGTNFEMVAWYQNVSGYDNVYIINVRQKGFITQLISQLKSLIL